MCSAQRDGSLVLFKWRINFFIKNGTIRYIAYVCTAVRDYRRYIDIADISGYEYRCCIDIEKVDIDPTLPYDYFLSMFVYLFTSCLESFTILKVKMSFSFGHLCVALLICCYCTVSASLECPDFNNIDVCEDEDLDLLRVSFGECDSKVQPKNAEREPVVKYDEADEVNTSIFG